MRTLLLFLSFIFFQLQGQESNNKNLLSLLNTNNEIIYSSYVFKGTKIVNGQSVEISSPGELQFLIQHRFGPLNSGFYNLYGLDYAQVRFGLEYGIRKGISLGLGRSSTSKTVDFNLKARLFRQSKGSKVFPITAAFNSAIYFQQYTEIESNLSSFIFTDQLIFSNQMLLARKINRNLSLQLTPTYLHYNAVENYNHNGHIHKGYHDSFSLGIGGRQKITKRISLNAETFIQLLNKQNNNVISFGFDIETGGHVFQLHLSNSPAMIAPFFITKTTAHIFEGDIYFGFNISRNFTLKKY